MLIWKSTVLRSFCSVLGFAAALSLLFPFSAVSDPSETDPSVQREETAQEVFGSVLSPFCPGVLLADCPSSAATELKQNIRGKASEGKSAGQIIDELFVEYGDEIRAAPERKGFGLVAWYAPLAFLACGLLCIVFWILSRRQSPAPVGERVAADTALEKRIERELQEL